MNEIRTAAPRPKSDRDSSPGHLQLRTQPLAKAAVQDLHQRNQRIGAVGMTLRKIRQSGPEQKKVAIAIAARAKEKVAPRMSTSRCQPRGRSIGAVSTTCAIIGTPRLEIPCGRNQGDATCVAMSRRPECRSLGWSRL